MGLTRISKIRRQELRRAAYEVLQKEGMAGATIEKVAQKAGASKGIVLHYFKTKQKLFEDTMRYANVLVRDEVVERMRRARTADQRLWAIIEGNFSVEFFTPSICHAWLALCAEVPRESELARIQRVVHARMRSNLLTALTMLVQQDQREEVALGVSALIDGLWLRLGLRSDEMSAPDALKQMADYLNYRIPDIDWNDHLRRSDRARRQTG